MIVRINFNGNIFMIFIEYNYLMFVMMFRVYVSVRIFMII